MNAKTYKLGDLIEPCDERNAEGKYTIDDVRGISTEKSFIKTKANMDGVSLNSYKVVNESEFAYASVTSRSGDKIALAFNEEKKSLLVSSIYTTFRVVDQEKLLPNFLIMYFNRPEFDRYSRFNSWGSARETFSWADFCDIEITLPSLPVQKKYVAIYQAMQENLKNYESGLEDLKLTCDGYIEQLRKKYVPEKIGKYIEEVNEKNLDNKIKEVRSVSVKKEFNLTNAKVNKSELRNYLIVAPNQLVFVQTTGNEKCLAFAYNDYDFSVLVSSVDKVIKSKDENVLKLQFLSLFLHRKEFDRYARYNSWGSAREVFTMSDMKEVEIPVPAISIQESIVNIYKCYRERSRLVAELKQKIKQICPILIKGSLEEDKERDKNE